MLDLDIGDLDAPGLGLMVEDFLDVFVQLVALLQHFVEVMLAEHGAQRRLRQLAGGRHIVFDLHHRTDGVDNAIIDHRIDLYRNVVL